MMNTPTKKTSVYDYVVIGSGLSGLCVATALSKEGAAVLLLEAADSFGGSHRAIQTKIGQSENGLTFLPDSELSHHALNFLSVLVGTPIKSESFEREVMTYESGGLKPFVGFGDDSPEFYEEIAFFLNSRELILEKPLSFWIQVLFENFKGEFQPRSHVTKMSFSEGKIHSLVLNGQRTIQALNVVYAGPLKSLMTLLPEEAFGGRARQKMGKAKFWTRIGIDFIHASPVTEFLGLQVLNGTTSDEIGPCVGKFLPAQIFEEQNVQMSQWTSFLDDEDAEDTEKVAAALKKMKRQLKRAYPQALDHLISERILVSPSFAGNGDLKLTGHQTLPLANNFWISSGAVHPLKNILGSLSQAQLVCSSLGVHPLGASLESEIKSADSNPDEAL